MVFGITLKMNMFGVVKIVKVKEKIFQWDMNVIILMERIGFLLAQK